MIIKEELENSFFKSNQAIEGVVERRRNKRTTTVMKTRCKLKDLLFSNGITLIYAGNGSFEFTCHNKIAKPKFHQLHGLVVQRHLLEN